MVEGFGKKWNNKYDIYVIFHGTEAKTPYGNVNVLENERFSGYEYIIVAVCKLSIWQYRAIRSNINTQTHAHDTGVNDVFAFAIRIIEPQKQREREIPYTQ